MASKPVLLLLGYGANIGHAAAKKFEAGGFHVAIAARSLSEEKVSDQRWSYPIDLAHPKAVTDLFAKTTKDIGIPSVVIYNGNVVTYFVAASH
jgi:NAD(P)-dependent dehydrogenase (short-subunit alcohol dehydrogenase family)